MSRVVAVVEDVGVHGSQRSRTGPTISVVARLRGCAPPDREENPMHFAEEEAERLPIGTFDHLESKRDRNGYRSTRYEDPNLIERWYGLPIAFAAYAVATIIFSRMDVGLVAALFIVFAVFSYRNDHVEQNHKRLWEEVFALRGGLAHALSHGADKCAECEKVRRLVPVWDAELRAKERAERESRSDHY
jgi:hypothetical protein